jgi:EAL domain-containing protein (putative c-di-GMP-specific phosphodiesterase class I)
MTYQPKITLKQDEPLTVESLIRWQRKDVGFVSPELFINVAEQSGLIVELTQWVFETVVKQVADWVNEGIQINAAVNVSSQDLLHKDFLGFVKNCCRHFNVDPKQITIEITERDIMHDEAHGIVSLIALKQAGFQIAIDDYGIGQSSLSKLKGLPIDKIKIDKTFIQQLDRSPKDQLIVKSTIELAHGLGCKVVAEGVENKASMTILEELGCDYAQGYYITKPILAEQLIQWQQNYVEDRTFFESQPV